jgi:hypothetical protein
MKHQRWMVAVFLCSVLLLMGNAPAPWYACEGKSPGDPCQWGYGCAPNGVCRLVEDCEDDPSTDLNECLQCHTSSAASP